MSRCLGDFAAHRLGVIAKPGKISMFLLFRDEDIRPRVGRPDLDYSD
jgi:hypothetical protein